jgi:hypothetical protein
VERSSAEEIRQVTNSKDSIEGLLYIANFLYDLKFDLHLANSDKGPSLSTDWH